MARSHKKSSNKKQNKSSSRRSSTRKSYVSKSSHKKSNRKERVKSHYRMRGMGGMLSMFGGAVEQVESDYQAKREAFLQAQAEYKQENDKRNREKLRQIMESAKVGMYKAKDKMSAILKGVEEAASKAASQLSDSAKAAGRRLNEGAKSIGSKLSSGLKSFGSRLSSGFKSFGSKVSSGTKSLVSSAKDKYNKYKEDKDMAKWNKLNKKYDSPSVSVSSDSDVSSSE